MAIESFIFPFRSDRAFRLRLEELMPECHSEGSWFRYKHLKSLSILLQKQSGPSAEKLVWRNTVFTWNKFALANSYHSVLIPIFQLYHLIGIGSPHKAFSSVGGNFQRSRVIVIWCVIFFGSAIGTVKIIIWYLNIIMRDLQCEG